MKKSLFIIAIASIGFLNVHAQDRGDFELGIGLGLNVSNVSSTDGKHDTNYRLGFNAGVSGEYYFSDRWGLRIKLSHDSKGWADGYIEDGNSRYFETDFKLNYISIPIMGSYHFGSRRNWYLNFGPYIGFLTSAKDTELGFDIKNEFKTLDFGLDLSLGYKFVIDDILKLYIEYDSQSGFSDVVDENPWDSIRNWRNSLSVGVLINL